MLVMSKEDGDLKEHIMNTTTNASAKTAPSAGAEDLTAALLKQAATPFEQAAEVATLVRDQAISLIKFGEQLTLEAARKTAQVASELSSQLPNPIEASYLSDVRKTVEAGLDVSGQLLSTQRKIASAVLEAFSPQAR